MTTPDPAMVTRAKRGVYMLTARTANAIQYEVYVGDHPGGADGDSRRVWQTCVAFGSVKRNRAGGADFRDAAREQAAVADDYAEAARLPDAARTPQPRAAPRPGIPCAKTGRGNARRLAAESCLGREFRFDREKPLVEGSRWRSVDGLLTIVGTHRHHDNVLRVRYRRDGAATLRVLRADEFLRRFAPAAP